MKRGKVSRKVISGEGGGAPVSTAGHRPATMASAKVLPVCAKPLVQSTGVNFGRLARSVVGEEGARVVRTAAAMADVSCRNLVHSDCKSLASIAGVSIDQKGVVLGVCEAAGVVRLEPAMALASPICASPLCASDIENSQVVMMDSTGTEKNVNEGLPAVASPSP